MKPYSSSELETEVVKTLSGVIVAESKLRQACRSSAHLINFLTTEYEVHVFFVIFGESSGDCVLLLLNI